MSRISEEVSIPKATVQGIIKRIKESESPLPERPKGAPKKMNDRDLRRLETITRREPFASYDKINVEIKLHRIDICRATLIHYLRQIGFGSYFAAHKPRLTEVYKKKRLRWAKERVHWTTEQWRGVVWSDELRFTVEGNDKGVRVLRKVGERYKKDHIVETTKWVFIDGNVDQTAYVNILASKFHPWFTKLCEKEDRDFIFQEDGASCHTGAYTTWWKNTHSIKRFDYWPAQSPDLNPIDHIWHSLEALISDKRACINNVDDLRACLEVARNDISIDLATRLVGSMPDRCRAVIEAKGGATRF
ncbi:hypothetical protein INT47_005231 [Mucor saturninus]|uniref:Transposase n=1 Tax=Mucor saturninus TaxID=64648 RepID=A0A8H7V263_9FUNG|nr:hypothetical protein INT47_005231 [Mucor saturninus]